MKIGPIALFHKLHTVMLAKLLPYGIWGIGTLAVLDSGAIPMPIDALMIDFVVHDKSRFVLYSFMGALGSAIGSLVFFYIGRAGGELFLMKRVNRKRYEQLRDKFERQEFLALMIPAMMPPPTPIKLFEFAAGVFEMKTIWFFTAMLTGKFIRFLAESLLAIYFGQAILDTMSNAIHAHMGWVLGIGGVLGFLLAFWVLRKIFGRKNGAELLDEEEGGEETGA